MERSNLIGVSHLFCVTVALLGANLATARADNIPAFTVTDLGAGTARLSTDVNGNGIVVAPDGKTTYAFPITDNSVSDLSSILPSLPALANPFVGNSMTYGDPNNAYSKLISNGFLNPDGLFVTTNLAGVNGHTAPGFSAVVTSQRQADGSFGPWMTRWAMDNNSPQSGPIAHANFLNNQNQILGMGESSPTRNWTSYLYDVNSQTLTNLQDVVKNFHLDLGAELGLDDQGRILLLGGDYFTGEGWVEHSLLLTPANLSSDPITVPEPSALAALAVGLGGLLLGRHRSSRGT